MEKLDLNLFIFQVLLLPQNSFIFFQPMYCTRVTQKGKNKSPLTLASATLPPSALALSYLRAVIMVAYCEVVCDFKMPNIPCFQRFLLCLKLKFQLH